MKFFFTKKGEKMNTNQTVDKMNNDDDDDDVDNE